jgi:hypothetical protein
LPQAQGAGQLDYHQAAPLAAMKQPILTFRTIELSGESEGTDRQVAGDAEAVSQLLRRARTQHLAHYQTQVEASHVDQLPLQNVLVTAQMGSPHAAGFIAMREAAFD